MPIDNVLQALECSDVCHPKWWTVANSQGAGCQARIDLYTNTMLPLQGILKEVFVLENEMKVESNSLEYWLMQDSGVKMEHFTFSMIVRVYTRLASLEHAKQAHTGLIFHGFGLDIVANTAIIDFHNKWGRIHDARNVFDKMSHKNFISWNALIIGYGNKGRGIEALELFKKMITENMILNHVTFLAVLSACSYSSLSDQGWDIFESMGTDFKMWKTKIRCFYFQISKKKGLRMLHVCSWIDVKTQQHMFVSAAEMMYGLIHPRYILTTRGMFAMCLKHCIYIVGKVQKLRLWKVPKSLLFWTTLSSCWRIQHTLIQQCQNLLYGWCLFWNDFPLLVPDELWSPEATKAHTVLHPIGNYPSPYKKSQRREVDDVAHGAALALTEASQRGSSPHVSQSPYHMKSTPLKGIQKILDIVRTKRHGNLIDEEIFEGSSRSGGAENEGYKKVRKFYGQKDDNDLNDGGEACSGTGEGFALGVGGKFDENIEYSSQGKRKRTRNFYSEVQITTMPLEDLVLHATGDKKNKVSVEKEKVGNEFPIGESSKSGKSKSGREVKVDYKALSEGKQKRKNKSTSFEVCTSQVTNSS
uniref:Pentatricopeptide repeat-containing protein n=1 Tax=Lactuca sativa TaxID=4236 RepID=A0A9R1W958_LACSA|nr:hypothetical protein LSAT_V11C300156540 [Lactuca sativa]